MKTQELTENELRQIDGGSAYNNTTSLDANMHMEGSMTDMNGNTHTYSMSKNAGVSVSTSMSANK